MELNFEGLKIQKSSIPTDGAQRADEKWGHLSSYHIDFRSYGH